ncbi:MAG: hypothetical protein HQ509_06940 [Candidatus Marinimicrobia bacterium]|nr:hypothetical protein [Candidatus Neomarinimicrobiota bacterium]
MTNRIYPPYRRKGFFAIILIAFGVVMNSSLGTTPGTIGTVMIGVGGLFLISTLNEKRDYEEKNDE